MSDSLFLYPSLAGLIASLADRELPPARLDAGDNMRLINHLRRREQISTWSNMQQYPTANAQLAALI
jgi:hypothetical protein